MGCFVVQMKWLQPTSTFVFFEGGALRENVPMSAVFVGVELGGTDVGDVCQNDRCCSSTVYSTCSSRLCEGLS